MPLPLVTGDVRRLIGIGLAVAVTYVIAAWLGFRFAFVAEQITTVWAPTGIALAALLLWGRALWPAIWLGAFVANAGTAAPLWTAAAVATGNSLEAVVAAWILRRFLRFDPALRRLRDAVAFIVVGAVMSTAISATIGVTALCAAAVQPWTRFSALWPDWWLGDAFGALVVAPVILTTVRTPSPWSRRAWVETCLLVIGAAAVSQVVFGQRFPAFGQHPLEYVIFAFVITAAVRLGQPAAALVVLGASAVTIWNTVRGAGPFAVADVHHSLFLLQAFMGVLAFTGLLLAAAIVERRTSERTRAAAFAVGDVLTDAPNLTVAAPAILRAVCENLGWRVSALWLIDPDLQRLRCLAVWSDDVGQSTAAFAGATKETLLSSGVGLPGRVWATRKAAWIENVVDDPNFPRASAAAKDGIRGAFAFPICLGGEVLGVIECFNRTVIAPDPDLLRTMSTVGSQVGQFMGRKREETAVLEAERHTRAILDTALDAIIGMNHHGLITGFNPAAERVFGYRAEEVLGRELAELLIPRELRDQHRGGLARYLASGHGPFIDRRVETIGHHADGHTFPVEVAITRVSDEDPPRFTGFVRDLTARAHAEREREQVLQREQIALREAELQKRFLYSLFMQAPTLIAVLRGPAHVIELANPHMREVWGHTEDELRDRPLFEVMPELQEQVFKQILDDVYRTGVPYVGREIPARFDRGSGVVGTVYFNFVYSPFKNVHGEIEGIFVIASDVTDQVSARQQVDQLREQADAANRAKDEFLATLSTNCAHRSMPSSAGRGYCSTARWTSEVPGARWRSSTGTPIFKFSSWLTFWRFLESSRVVYDSTSGRSISALSSGRRWMPCGPRRMRRRSGFAFVSPLQHASLKATLNDCNRSSGTCSPTPSNSRSLEGSSMSTFSTPERTVYGSVFKTTEPVSIRHFSGMCSNGFARQMGRSAVSIRASDSAWRSFDIW